MKKVTLLVAIIFASCSINKLQQTNPVNPKKAVVMHLSSFNGDSVSYVKKQFIDNKANYIGMPLSKLLEDNEIEIKSFMYTPDNISANCSSITLCADDRNMASRKNNLNKKPLFIFVDFTIPVPMDKIVALGRKNNGAWTREESTLFKNYKIRNINLTDNAN